MEALAGAYARADAAVKPAVFAGLKAALGLDLAGPGGLSPLTAGLPGLESPTPLLCWMATYLVVISLGLAFRTPKRKGAEDPPWVRGVTLVHNVLLIALSSYMCLTAIYQAFVVNSYSFWGQGYSAKEVGMGRIIYVFYMSKWYEFFDTFVMVLKGNLHQISFLHVYHHLSISFIWWVIAYHAPGGDAWYSCALNSFIHVCMYSYYLLASLSGGDPKFRKKYLWWGKYMTMMQMTQFASMMAQASYMMYLGGRKGGYPLGLAKLLFYYMITLLYLFGSFFVKRWTAPKGPKKKSA